MTLNDLIEFYKKNNISKDAEIQIRVSVPDRKIPFMNHLKLIELEKMDIEYHDPCLIIYTPTEYYDNL